MKKLCRNQHEIEKLLILTKTCFREKTEDRTQKGYATKWKSDYQTGKDGWYVNFLIRIQAKSEPLVCYCYTIVILPYDYEYISFLVEDILMKMIYMTNLSYAQRKKGFSFRVECGSELNTVHYTLFPTSSFFCSPRSEKLLYK